MKMLKHSLTQSSNILFATRTVLGKRTYGLGWLILAGVFFFLFVSIPVRTIPGNSFLFQLELLSVKELILLSSLAFLASLSFTMQWYLWRRKSELKRKMGALGTGGAGGLGAIVASMFGTATCASCVAALFGFLGVGMVLTLIDWRNYIVAFSFILLFVSLYFSSRRIVNKCLSCETR